MARACGGGIIATSPRAVNHAAGRAAGTRPGHAAPPHAYDSRNDDCGLAPTPVCPAPVAPPAHPVAHPAPGRAGAGAGPVAVDLPPTLAPGAGAQVVRAALPLLSWFTLLAAIVSVVIIRIVLVTAQSYGLSQVALEVVVRVLVLELIPLSAAFAVALRVSVPLAGELAHGPPPGPAGRRPCLRRRRAAQRDRATGAGRACSACCCWLPWRRRWRWCWPTCWRMGCRPGRWSGYTRMVGHVFSPAVSVVFVLKTGRAGAGGVGGAPRVGAARAFRRAGRWTP
jgi:hypothetical protein